MKIAVVGIGYVGLSIATLLSQKNEVIAFDIDSKKIDMINKKISPIKDKEIEKFLITKNLNLKATLNSKEAFNKANYIIICTPTNYNDKTNYFDTSSIENVIEEIIKININCTIVIKSTVPIGYTENIKNKYNLKNILFCPEFLREGHALYDNLYPSRIIIGEKNKIAKKFATLLKECILKNDVTIKYMNSTEAEAVKLFSNTYLALRIAYFNELDTFAEINNLNVKDIIEGVCLDPRIGNYYNNPSFGYGGYCLPKDTKQLLTNYNNIPQNLINATVKSNNTRKQYITENIIKNNPKTVGIYKLTMKKNSDNFRESSIQEILENLRNNNINLIIYEPLINTDTFNDCKVINDFETFSKQSDIIIANRYETELSSVSYKLYTRDLFNRD